MTFMAFVDAHHNLNVVLYAALMASQKFGMAPSEPVTVTVTICGDACPLSCVSAEAYKLAQCTRPQGWGR